MESAKHTVTRRSNDIYLTPQIHTATLIFMHGLGDTAEGWVDLFLGSQNFCPVSTKIVLLTAPVRHVTVAGRKTTAWFDVKEFNAPADRVEKSIAKEDVIESTERIFKVLDEEVEILKGESKKVFIGGFSQGCAMSLHAGLGYNKPLGGVIGLSGYMFSFTTVAKENEKVSIFLSHGLTDRMISFQKADESYKRLDASKHDIVRVTEKTLEHSINQVVLAEAAKFIRKNLDSELL